MPATVVGGTNLPDHVSTIAMDFESPGSCGGSATSDNLLGDHF